MRGARPSSSLVAPSCRVSGWSRLVGAEPRARGIMVRAAQAARPHVRLRSVAVNQYSPGPKPHSNATNEAGDVITECCRRRNIRVSTVLRSSWLMVVRGVAVSGDLARRRTDECTEPPLSIVKRGLAESALSASQWLLIERRPSLARAWPAVLCHESGRPPLTLRDSPAVDAKKSS